MLRASLACCLMVAATLACQSAPPPEPPPLRADYADPHPAVESFLTIAAHRAGRGDRAGAVAAADAAVRNAPTSGAAQLARAELLARSDDPNERAEARETVTAIETVHPGAPGLPAARAALALGEGDPDGAWEAIEPALALSADPELHTLAAEILLAQGHETEAIREADRVLEARPRDGQALAVRARAHQRLGADAAAAADARRALRVRPDDAELRLLRAESLLRTGNARSAGSALGALDPNARSARSERLAAAIALDRGDPAAARDAYERGLERSPGDAATVRALAELDLAEGDTDGALARLADDSTSEGMILRARSLEAAERPDEAAATLRALLAREPDLLEPWGLLLAVSPELADPAERARTAWEGPTPDASADAVPGTLVLSALLEEDEQRAAALYDEALAKRPGLALAANNRASQLLSAGRERDRALHLAEAAFEASGGHPWVADTLGWALLEASRPEEAIVVLSHGLAASSPKNEVSRVLLARRAQAYEAAGEDAVALAAADALLDQHDAHVAAADRAGDAAPAEPPWLADTRELRDRLTPTEPAPAAAPEAPEAPEPAPTAAPEAPEPAPNTAEPDSPDPEQTRTEEAASEAIAPEEPGTSPAPPDATTAAEEATDD